MSKTDIARYRENWQGEIDAAFTYRCLAEAETRPQLREVYERMSAIEARHAEFWEEKLRASGAKVGERKPSTRARITAWVGKKFGPQSVVPTLAAVESGASSNYDTQAEAHGTSMASDERSHARVLQAISSSPERGGMEGGALAKLEGRHRNVGGNALRAAVLGANDGLVSSLSLVMGVAGANPPGRAVMIAGLAGVLAGACAMAMGEWLSVQSARELAQRQLAVEEQELNANPEEEQEELALIYQAKGLPAADAQSLAAKLIADRSTALDTLAREELGLDPEELGGSAWEAAYTSFALFVAGAVAPVAPWIFLEGRAAILVSLVCSAVALFGIGAAITLLTGQKVLFSGMRQLLIGLAAAAVTFGVGALIGHLFGINVAG